MWKPLTVIKYWESLRKSKRPKNTSYEILTKHYKDPLVPVKLQFFAFVPSIFQPCPVIFQTNSPMISFMCSGLEKIFNQLLRLVFSKDVIDQTGGILEKNKEWLTNKKSYVEDSLVDVGSATKYLLEQAKVSAEKKRAFEGECKKMIIDILVKLQENTPLRHTIIRNSSALISSNMVHKSDNCSIRLEN